MFCLWKFPYSNINCSNDFRLEYNNHEETTYECIPENMPRVDSRSPNECICHIKVDFFVASDVYNILVKSHGTSVQNITVVPPKKVKPKPPANVTIEHGDDETAIFRWDSRYTEEDYLFQKLFFAVQISSKQEPEEVKTTTLHQVESHYIIKNRLLRRGHDYIMKVKSKPNSIAYDGTWSEWSPSAEWHNDYNLLPHDIMAIIVPASGPVIFICILLCSACVSFCKKKWCNNIPDPARSRLVYNLLHTSQVPVLKSEMNCNILPNENKRSKKTIYDNRLKGFREQDEADQDSQNNNTTTGYQNLFKYADMKNIVFIPELTVIERLVEICPIEDYMSSINEPEEHLENDDGEDHLLECDFINQMFLDILESNKEPVRMTCTFDSLEDEDGFSFPTDACHTVEKYLSQLEASPQFACQSYISGNSPVEIHREHFRLDEKYETQKGSMVYTPIPNNMFSDDNCNTATLQDYTSFGDAVRKSVATMDTNYYKPPTGREPEVSHCLKRISSYHCTSNDNPRPYLPFTADFADCQVTLKSECDQLLPVRLKYTEHNSTELYDPPLYKVSEYQSFDEAVEQENNPLGITNCPMVETAYKPLETLITPNANYLDNYSYLCEFLTKHTWAPQMGVFNGADHRDGAKILFEETVQRVLSTGSGTLRLVETCDGRAMETHHPSNTKDCSDKHKACTYLNSYSKMVLQNTDIGGIPYALTFDISYHMKSCAHMYDCSISPYHHPKMLRTLLHIEDQISDIPYLTTQQ
ncbi:uncharacterized protein LOC142097601 isoform X2 [Mixophyes fleayi]